MTDQPIKVLDLFSGIGGFSLGLERAGMETVAFCENDVKCEAVLNKHWPHVTKYRDIKTLTKERLDKNGITDIRLICGGYPCQPFSVAGQRNGQEDDRHLWPEMFRLIKEIRPDWVIAENVTGHISMGLDDVLADLEGQNYTCQTFVIPAAAIDAKHRRDRLWIVANANNQRQLQSEGFEQEIRRRTGDSREVVADPNGFRRYWGPEKHRSEGREIVKGSGQAVANASSFGQPQPRQSVKSMRTTPDSIGQTGGAISSGEYKKWPVEPNVGRVANGVSGRMDRLKQLGNAVVPQILTIIGSAIVEVEKLLSEQITK